MEVSRELTRLESISASPTIQKFKEGLIGVSTIRFFNQTDFQFRGFFQKVDQFQRNSIPVRGAKNWFIIRVSLLTLMIIIPTVFISVSQFLFVLMNFIAVHLEPKSRDVWFTATLCTVNNR